MRAINLVPADERPGRVNGGKSNGAVYGLLIGLIVVLVAASSLAMTKKKQAQAKADLAAVQQSTQAFDQIAAQFSSYESAASNATSRIETVRGLAQARFDWAGAMRDLSRVVPANVQITELNATVKPGLSVGNGGTALRTAIGTPAITMTGCATDQDAVANLLGQLEAQRRVTQVSLDSSIQNDSVDPACTVKVKKSAYVFNLVVFYAQGNAQAAADAVPGSTPVTASLATESAGGSTAPTTPAAGN
jgi:Tfp pilus assembly protein PilN